MKGPEAKFGKGLMDSIRTTHFGWVAKTHGGAFSAGLPDLIGCSRHRDGLTISTMAPSPPAGRFFGLELKAIAALPKRLDSEVWSWDCVTELQRGALQAIAHQGGSARVLIWVAPERACISIPVAPQAEAWPWDVDRVWPLRYLYEVLEALTSGVSSAWEWPTSEEVWTATRVPRGQGWSEMALRSLVLGPTQRQRTKE